MPVQQAFEKFNKMTEEYLMMGKMTAETLKAQVPGNSHMECCKGKLYSVS